MAFSIRRHQREGRTSNPLPAEFFNRFGIYTQRRFLSPEDCATLREEMRTATGKSATVATGEGEAIEEASRKTKQADVPRAAAEQIRGRLLEALPGLAKHFDRELAEVQPPQFLVYREGDYFHAHHDDSEDPDAPDYVRQRVVSTVVFVNGETPGDPAGYSGGSLTFYGLMDDGVGRESVGLPLAGEPGLLVAFPPHLVHSVSPVTSGERYTVVTWFVEG
jgi:predicted 2-oxoglutarate/Fe(II)-dependent dioxygenase YbiX